MNYCPGTIFQSEAKTRALTGKLDNFCVNYRQILTITFLGPVKKLRSSVFCVTIREDNFGFAVSENQLVISLSQSMLQTATA
jgi:hypothetical protein